MRIRALLICLLLPVFVAAQNNSPDAAVRLAATPVYPPLALTANTAGDVQVVVTLDKAGNVKKADFLNGNPLLHKAAVEAAKRWKFEKLNEEVRIQLTFSFRIMPKETSAEDMTPVFMPPYHLEVRGKLPEPTVNY
jgi:TonB family protein